MTQPLVSIVIPVFNVEHHLRQCLDSVLRQTLKEWECICVDDGSPDGSGAILDEYGGRDARFKIIHQRNQGVSAARNLGIELASAPYLTRTTGLRTMRWKTSFPPWRSPAPIW